MIDNNELKEQYAVEVNTGVSFGGLFSTLTVFFTGLLISNYASFPIQVRVPLLFLIISTFGFIYMTLIYANASGKLTTKEIGNCGKAIETADILGEFMGVYALLISIPLVIPIVTDDKFLVGAVLIADVVGMFVYHMSGYSIIQKYYPKNHLIIMTIMVMLMISILVLLKSDYQGYLLSLVTVTIMFLIMVTIQTINKLSKLSSGKD